MHDRSVCSIARASELSDQTLAARRLFSDVFLGGEKTVLTLAA